jgi:cysteine-rich repeat protein
MTADARKLGWLASTVLGALTAGPATAMPGNTCAEAIAVATLPFSSSGTTCGAGDDFQNQAAGAAVCSDLPQGYGGTDVFYKLTLQQGNQVAFDLSLPAGATGDLALFLVRAPSCSDPLVCAGNSVDLIGAGLGPERIKANAQAYPSGTYYLIVDSKLSAPDPASCGAYDLAITGHLSAFCGNGTVDPGELCDDGNSMDGDCCAADCQSKAAAGTTCRAAPLPCDVAETCNADGTCPADAVRPAGDSCRPTAGVCDVAEVCDGLNKACPVDRLAPATAVCRPAVSLCDATETCTGTQPSCPPDLFKPPGAQCGPATNCVNAPICNGGGSCLPGVAVSCEDNNACTLDRCNPAFGCVHTPMCQDAGADDAGPDAHPDTAAADIGAADMSVPPPDLGARETDPPTVLPEPPSTDRRDGPIEALVDAPGPQDSITAPDGAPPALDAKGPTLDRPPMGPEDAIGSDIGPGPGHQGDAVAPADGGNSDGRQPTGGSGGGNGVAPSQNGCSCRLGGGVPSPGGSSLPLIVTALLLLVALRRRST